MNYLSHQVRYLFGEVCKKYPSILEEIRERRFTVGNTGFSSRNINTLDELGLLPKTRDSETQWRKFNLNDLLYIYIIEQCKKFNIDSKLLRSIQNLFYAETRNYKDFGEVTPTEESLIVMLTESVPINIKLYSAGVAIISDIQAFDINEALSKTAMYIDVYNTFNDQIQKFKSNADFKNKYDLTEFENGYFLKAIKPENARLLSIIQEKEYTKITITKKPNGKIEINGEKIAHAPRLTEKDIKSLIGDIGEGKIELSIKDGVSQHLTVKKSHKV
jgi:hypothetical protein